MGAPVSPVWEQEDYAFYSDGTESGATIIGTAGTQQTLSVDTVYHCRLAVGDTAGAGKTATTLDVRWQYNLAGGGWNTVTGSTPVQFVDNANLTDGGSTTNRQPTGTGTFNAGRIYESQNDGAGVYSVPNDYTTSHTEVLLHFQIDSSQVSDGQECLIRCVEGDGTAFNSYVDADIDISKSFATYDAPVTAQTGSTEASISTTYTKVHAVTVTAQTGAVEAAVGTDIQKHYPVTVSADTGPAEASANAILTRNVSVTAEAPAATSSQAATRIRTHTASAAADTGATTASVNSTLEQPITCSVDATVPAATASVEALNTALVKVFHYTTSPPTTGDDASWSITVPAMAGLTPKAVIVAGTWATTDGTSRVDGNFSLGTATGSTTGEQWTMVFGDEDNQNPSDCGIRGYNDRCFEILDSVKNPSSTFSLVSFDNGGATFNWNEVNGQYGFTITFTFLCGDNMTAEAATDLVSTSKQSWTGLGVTPHFVFGGYLTTNPGGSSGEAAISIGTATGSGTSVSQQCAASWADDNVTTTSMRQGVYDSYFAARVSASASSPAASITINEFTSSGFDHTASTAGNHIYFLAVNFGTGIDVWSDIITTPTSTGDQSITAPGFEPQFVGLIPSVCASVNTLETGRANSFGIGMMDADGQSSQIVMGQDGLNTTTTPTNTNSLTDTDYIIRQPTDSNTESVSTSIRVVPDTGGRFTADGFDLTYSYVDTSNGYKYVAFAIQSSTSEPTWTAQVDADVGSTTASVAAELTRHIQVDADVGATTASAAATNEGGQAEEVTITATVGATTAAATAVFEQDAQVSADTGATTAAATAVFEQDAAVSADTGSTTAAVTTEVTHPAQVSADTGSTTASIATEIIHVARVGTGPEILTEQLQVDDSTVTGTNSEWFWNSSQISISNGKLNHVSGVAAVGYTDAGYTVSKTYTITYTVEGANLFNVLFAGTTVGGSLLTVGTHTVTRKAIAGQSNVLVFNFPLTDGSASKVTNVSIREVYDDYMGPVVASITTESTHTVSVDANTGSTTAAIATEVTHPAQVSADTGAVTASIASTKTKDVAVDANTGSTTASVTTELTRQASVDATLRGHIETNDDPNIDSPGNWTIEFGDATVDAAGIHFNGGFSYISWPGEENIEAGRTYRYSLEITNHSGANGPVILIGNVSGQQHIGDGVYSAEITATQSGGANTHILMVAGSSCDIPYLNIELVTGVQANAVTELTRQAQVDANTGAATASINSTKVRDASVSADTGSTTATIATETTHPTSVDANVGSTTAAIATEITHPASVDATTGATTALVITGDENPAQVDATTGATTASVATELTRVASVDATTGATTASVGTELTRPAAVDATVYERTETNTDPDCDSAVGWTLQNCTVSGGHLVFPGDDVGSQEAVWPGASTIKAGERYQVTVKIGVKNNTSSFIVWVGNTVGIFPSDSQIQDGAVLQGNVVTATQDFSGTNTFIITANGNNDLTLDYVHIEKVVGVTADVALNRVHDSSVDATTGSTTAAIATELTHVAAVDADVTGRSQELLTDLTCSETYWGLNFGSGSVNGDGTISLTGAGGIAQPDNDFSEAWKWYEFTFTVSGLGSGDYANVYIGFISSTQINTNGTHKVQHLATGVGKFGFGATIVTGPTVTISGVSVKEVLGAASADINAEYIITPDVDATTGATTASATAELTRHVQVDATTGAATAAINAVRHEQHEAATDATTGATTAAATAELTRHVQVAATVGAVTASINAALGIQNEVSVDANTGATTAAATAELTRHVQVDATTGATTAAGTIYVTLVHPTGVDATVGATTANIAAAIIKTHTAGVTATVGAATAAGLLTPINLLDAAVTATGGAATADINAFVPQTYTAAVDANIQSVVSAVQLNRIITSTGTLASEEAGLYGFTIATHTVQYSLPVYRTSEAGISFRNVTTGETTSSVTSSTGNGSDVISYKVTWVTAPRPGDVVQLEYDSTLGDYNKGDPTYTPMATLTFIIENCYDRYL